MTTEKFKTRSKYIPAGWGPKYLKIRVTRNKKGETSRYYVRADRSGCEPLVAAVPAELTSRRDIARFADLKYAAWLSDSEKPKVVEEAEEIVEKATVRFASVASEVLELTESLSDEYYRKVKYHIGRLNEWFGVECEFIADWNDNLWKKYVAFRRRAHPQCQLNHDRAQLRRILLHALAEGHITKKPILKNFDTEVEGGRALSDAELNALYAAASQDLRDEMDLGVRQAFRQIDVRHLTKERVDLQAGKVRFERGMRTDEGGQKNKKPLVLDLNPVCLEMLRRRAGALNAAYGSNWTYFFHAPSNPNKPKGSNKTAWYAACRRAGIENTGFHCLRHTCATKLARAGRAEAFTQKFCRMSAVVIRQIYTHLEAEDSALLANTITEQWGLPNSPALPVMGAS